MAEGSSLLAVKIDFDQSHLFFPHLIHWILLILGLLIIVTHGPKLLRQWRARAAARSTGAASERGGFDWVRLLGTIVLTVIYFSLMDTVGEYFPNMGLGFLLMSMPFMFLLSVLYVHDASRRQYVTITLSSILSPTVAWYLLAQVFNITLP